MLVVVGIVALARTQDRSRATTTTSTAVASTIELGGRRPLADFGQVRIRIRAADGRTCEACMLAAETPEQRSRGLMEVTDPALGGYDGMLFSFPDRPGSGGFWMRRTRIPLRSVFFDAQGRYLANFAMTPCPDSTADVDCPRYGPDVPYASVVELAALEPADLLMGEGSTITVAGTDCPARLAGRD